MLYGSLIVDCRIISDDVQAAMAKVRATIKNLASGMFDSPSKREAQLSRDGGSDQYR